MTDPVAPYPNELKTCIKLAGYKVRQVSQKTHIPESTLHDWAAGNRVIPHDERLILADLLDCEICQLAPQIPSQLPSRTEAPGPGRDLPSESHPLVVDPPESTPFSQAMTQDTIGVPVREPEDQQEARKLSAPDGNRTQQPTPAGTQQEDAPLFLSTEQVMLLLSIVRGDDIMAFDQSKRDTLRSIAAAVLTATHSPTTEPFAASDPEPWERLFKARIASSPSTLLNADTLGYFEDLLKISWQLCDRGQLAPAEGVLVSFLPHILSLSKQEPSTASLAANGLHLQSILAGHHLRLSDKVRLCEQSIHYAHETGDANILVTTLVQLVVAYEYAKQPEKRWKPLQEALDQSYHASPLVQSRLYSEYSFVLAENKRLREAELYRGLALEVFPDDPTKDPAFAFANSNIFIYSYCAGLISIHTSSIEQAFSAFEHYKQHPSGLIIPERNRLEIANGQSRAAIWASDAERYAGLLEDVLDGALRIGSQKRFDEALGIFRREMPASWLEVDCIKQLAERYGLKREVEEGEDQR